MGPTVTSTRCSCYAGCEIRPTGFQASRRYLPGSSRGSFGGELGQHHEALWRQRRRGRQKAGSRYATEDQETCRKNNLLDIGLKKFKGSAIKTLAYSLALTPDKPFINHIMERLLAEDEVGLHAAVVPENAVSQEVVKGKGKRKTCSGKKKQDGEINDLTDAKICQTALSNLFGLTEREYKPILPCSTICESTAS